MYPGDEMYHKVQEAWVKVVDFTDTGVFVYESSGDKNTTVRRNLTWTKPKTKREGWINVYQNQSYDAIHHIKEDADRSATRARMDCVRVEYEF